MNPNPENAEPVASEKEAHLESSEPQADLAKLGPSTSSVLEALQSDLEKARRIASNYQTVLKGKESELAKITELFEKTRSHLIELQLNVTKLRDERHRLGNRAMEADALERKLTVVTIDRDRLREELHRRTRWHG